MEQDSKLSSELMDIDHDDVEKHGVERPSLHTMMSPSFYQRSVRTWSEELCEGLFKIQIRGTTIRAEVYYGVIHFISCFFFMAVVPRIMASAGYATGPLFLTVTLTSALGCIFGGLVINLPFPFAPPTAIAIFFSSSLSKYPASETQSIGSSAVVLSGIFIMLLGYRPLSDFVGRLIPSSIQIGTSIGIGLLTTLAGAIEVGLVETGHSGNLLQMGDINNDVIIALLGVALICILAHYHVTGPFAIVILICSLLSWAANETWPTSVINVRQKLTVTELTVGDGYIGILTIDLVFLYILYLAGLTSSLSRLAELNREDGSTPRSRWIYVFVGLINIVSGFLTGTPILISPESAAGIKEGAKTGLSTMVCGVLFLVASLFSPVFQAVPLAGTAPTLMMVGLLLFQNVVRIDWKSMKDSAPAFIVLFFIPFTYSLIQGVLIGYGVYLIISVFTGDLFYNTGLVIEIYFPEYYHKFMVPCTSYISQYWGKSDNDDDIGVDDYSLEADNNADVLNTIIPTYQKDTQESSKMPAYTSSPTNFGVAGEGTVRFSFDSSKILSNRPVAILANTGTRGRSSTTYEDGYMLGYDQNEIFTPRSATPSTRDRSNTASNRGRSNTATAMVTNPVTASVSPAGASTSSNQRSSANSMYTIAALRNRVNPPSAQTTNSPSGSKPLTIVLEETKGPLSESTDSI